MSERYGFTKENKGKVDAALDFPRLKLEKKGEKARLAIFAIEVGDDGKRTLALPNPEGGYYFDLRVPGADREYIGSFECIAPEATKREGEFDADACPHCAVALAGNVSEEIMRPRSRKFIMPVIRYNTQAASSELIVPHSVEAIAWRFTDRYFNVIVDEHAKWESSGGLLGHDLTLTCEVVQYQNFTISVEPNAAYAENRDLGKLVLETYVSQTALLTQGLGRVLGSKLNAVDLERKIAETIETAAQLGIGGPTATTVPSVDPATMESIAQDLLGGSSGSDDSAPEGDAETPTEASEVPAPAVAEPAGGVDFDEFFGGK